MKNKLLLLFIGLGFFANAVTWKVGATQTYTTPSAVVNLVQNNDTIKIDGGVYLNDPVIWTKKNLVFIGLGTGSNRSIMRWTGGDIANGKGIWVFANPSLTGNATVDNIVFEGARVSDSNGGNGAGIRCQAKDLTIRNCQFNSCQNGILEGGSYTGAIVTIQNSEFFNNGYEVIGNVTFSGYEHNIYISSQTDSLLVKNCYFHSPRGEANSLKTRAQKNYILYNVIDEALGQGSWEINIAQGGLTVIIGNTIIQGVNSINHGIVSYDAATNPIQDFYFINNTVINKYTSTSFRYFNVSPTSGINKFKVYNNIFAKALAANMSNFISGSLGSALDTLSNRILNNYTTVGFVNATGNDFHLTSTALSFINNCSNAGLASNGFSLLPLNEYVNFTSALAPRVMSGPANDIGAFEFNSGVGVNENTSSEYVISVYPNPSENYFSVDLKNNSPENLSITIYDVLGKEIKHEKLSENKTIIRHDLRSGVYFYSIFTDSEKTQSGKIIVQ